MFMYAIYDVQHVHRVKCTSLYTMFMYALYDVQHVHCV